MKIEVKVSAEEVCQLVADHLSKQFGFPINPEDLSYGSYSGEVILGKYGGFEYQPRPKKAAETVPAAATELNVFSNEETKPAEQPF